MTKYSALQFGLDIADRVIPASLLRRLDTDGFISAAGVEPSVKAREGLRQFMAAVAKDTVLTLFGRLSVQWDMIRLLRNAAKIEQSHCVNPALGAAPVKAPIFILGLPRSGTTFLHSLLAEDPDNMAPRVWQTIYPAPRLAGFKAAGNAKVRQVDRQLKFFARLAPGFSELHPIHADSPQECSEITAHVFESLRFDTTFRVPDYLAWLETHGDLAGFQFHKKFLQYLQAGVPARWVLKCPDHTFSINAILSVYPDARFILVHRDPLEVFASVAYLTEVLRKPFLRNIYTAEIGAQVASRWIDGAQRLVVFDRRADIASSRKFHIHHDALISRPLETIGEIYQHFDMPLSAKAMTLMQQHILSRPRGGYLKHAPYSLKRFNVNSEQLGHQFANYIDAYCGC